MVMKTDSISGRELKVGSVFIPAGDKFNIYKVTDVTTAKPGKHGSAKSIVSAKHLKNGKSLNCTFLDSSERVTLITDFGYTHKIVYDKIGSEIVVNIETNQSLYTQSFIPDDVSLIEDEFTKLIKNRKLETLDNEGNPLVIKYSEFGDADNTLIFWELFYSKVSDLQRYGITDYCPVEVL